MDTFTGEMGKNISRVSEDVMSELRAKSLEVVDEYSQEDPEYCGKLGDMMHEFMRLTGKV